MPIKYVSAAGATGKARAAIITDVNPHTFTVSGGRFNAKLYNSVSNAKYDDEKHSIKLGTYKFIFHRRSDYGRFATKLKTMA